MFLVACQRSAVGHRHSAGWPSTSTVIASWEKQMSPCSVIMRQVAQTRELPAPAAISSGQTVSGVQEKTPPTRGSTLTRSHWVAVAPKVSNRVRLGTPA